MSRHYIDDDAIRRTGERVLACNLPKTEWTHAAHFAVALWLMRERLDIAPEFANLGAIIRAYNESTNTPSTPTMSGYRTRLSPRPRCAPPARTWRRVRRMSRFISSSMR